jgi:hypothetical protein
MSRKSMFLAVATWLVATLALSAEPTRWLNVHVTAESDRTEVQLHLPFPLVLAVVDSIHTAELHDGKIELRTPGGSVDWPTVIRELRSSPEGEYMTVKSPDADVVFTKKAGLVTIDVNQHDDEHAVVKVRLPVELLDAFSVDGGNRLDLKAMLSRLDRMTTGELVTVTSDDANVRIWVD